MENELFPDFSLDSSEKTPLEIEEDKIKRFKELKTREEIAELLELSDRGLRFQLYGKGKHNKYYTFEIPKKAGGVRKILAPHKPWKRVQNKLLEFLELFYAPRSSAHGFIKERSICSNARQHIKKRFVLNLDLKDFFPSITFRRVMGLFLNQPFNCPRDVAIVFAQIVTHNDELPQGAPTSPLISNMIAARLDSRLNKLAKSFRCKYTRYADDITISTNSNQFPIEIAEVSIDGYEIGCKLSNRLLRIIENNGFEVNEKKTRVRTPKQRQEVTGLVVNKKLNIPREFVKEVRAILFNWKKHGLEKCVDKYCSKNKAGTNKLTPDHFKKIIKGRIDYIGAVRGKTDSSHIKFLTDFAALAPGSVSEKTINWLREQDKILSTLDKLIIIEVDYPKLLIEERDGNQGTAFFLKDVGLVTCAHLFQEDNAEISAFRQNEAEKFRCNIQLFDDPMDIAILWNTIKDPHYFEPSTKDIKVGDEVFLAGFPNYSPWHVGVVAPAIVTAIRMDEIKNPRIQISTNIYSGNSGGPVFDKDWKVIGIAARGARNQDEAREIEFHGVIPLSEIYKLLSTEKAD